MTPGEVENAAKALLAPMRCTPLVVASVDEVAEERARVVSRLSSMVAGIPQTRARELRRRRWRCCSLLSAIVLVAVSAVWAGPSRGSAGGRKPESVEASATGTLLARGRSHGHQGDGPRAEAGLQAPVGASGSIVTPTPRAGPRAETERSSSPDDPRRAPGQETTRVRRGSDHAPTSPTPAISTLDEEKDLLVGALAAEQSGQWALAARRARQLVETYPTSPLAAEARRALSRMTRTPR